MDDIIGGVHMYELTAAEYFDALNAARREAFVEGAAWSRVATTGDEEAEALRRWPKEEA